MRTTKKIILTEKQTAYLKNHFKHMKNEEMADYLGVSLTTLHRMARKYGLKKSNQFMRKCQLEAAKQANISHTINGTYPPKGFIIPNCERYRFQKGVTTLQRIGAKREKERIIKSKTTMEQIRKSERARLAFGLPQKTKLHVHRTSRKKICLRYYLKKRGYIIDEEKRTAYWNESTTRSPRLEKNGTKYYKFNALN